MTILKIIGAVVLGFGAVCVIGVICGAGYLLSKAERSPEER